VLHHQIGVDVGMTEDQFGQAEVKIREGPDRRVAPRDGTARMTSGDRRGEVFEDPWGLPAGPDEAVERPVQGGDVARGRPDADGPTADGRRPGAGRTRAGRRAVRAARPAATPGRPGPG